MLTAFLGLIKKEFIQIRRDRNMLRIIFAMPIIQLLLLGYAVNTDVKNIVVDIYDFDQSRHSREFVKALEAGDYFDINESLSANQPLWKLDERLKNRSTEMAVIIDQNFSKNLTTRRRATVALITDGSNAASARTGQGYFTQISNIFSSRVTGQTLPITVRHKFLYNPELESVYYMIPGIVATLLTMVTVMLTSMAIVREREMGTLEQILVTPISSITLLLGKISTFAILGFIEITIALTVGVLWFGVPFVGSPLLLFGLSALFLLSTLGVGMFFSTITSTQQQAMFMAWFFSVFSILTSGFFTPISNMPELMQYVTYLNPMRYYMFIVRGIMMKGSGFFDLLNSIIPLLIYGILIFTFAATRFHKRAT